jgi:hypothetical protein
MGLLPLELAISDLQIASLTPGAAPFLEVRRCRLVPALGSVWAGPFILSRVTLEGLVVRIRAFPEGGDDIPHATSGSTPDSGVRIGRLTVIGGALELDHRRVPLELDLPDLRGRLDRRGTALAGRLTFGLGHIAVGSGPPLRVSTDMNVRFVGDRLLVDQARLRTERSDLAYTGTITLAADPVGEFNLHGPVDLEELDQHLWHTNLRIKGDGLYDGTLNVNGPRLRLKGRLRGTAGSFDGMDVPEFGGHLGWDERGVHLSGLQVRSFDGRATIDLEIPPEPEIRRLDAVYDGVDADGALAGLFHIGTSGIGSAATGTAHLTWGPSRFRYLSGQIRLQLQAKQDGRTPLRGRFDWNATAGTQQLQHAELFAPATTLRASGSIAPDDRLDLAVDGDAGDLAAADDLAMRVRRALGNAHALLSGFSGAGRFVGRCRGTLGMPSFTGRFSGQDVGYLGVQWGGVEWAGTADPLVVHSHSLRVQRGHGEIWLDGETATGEYAEGDAMSFRARLAEWPAEDFVRAFHWDTRISGPTTGEVAISGRRSRPVGHLHARLTAGAYYGVPFRDLVLTSRLDGRTATIDASARVGDGSVQLNGTLTDDETLDGTVTVQKSDLADVGLSPFAGATWSGRVSGSATLQGTLAHPRLTASFSSPGLGLGGASLGTTTLRFKADGDGPVAVQGACRNAEVDLSLSGRFSGLPPYESDLTLVARQTRLDPLLRLAAPQLPPAIGVVTTGTMAIRGPLSQPRRAAFDLALSDLQVQFPDHPVRNRQPVRATIRDGRLNLASFDLAGEGTNLVVSGDAGVFDDPDARLAMLVRGQADLRTLSIVTDRVRGRGTARLTINLTGTRRAPRSEGTLDLESGGLRLRGFPHGLEEVRGRLEFNESAARLTRLSARLAGGDVDADGEATYTAGRLTSFDVRASGRRVALRYPEGLRSVVDGDLRFTGDADRQWVTGDVTVRQAVWTRRYDIASELLAAQSVPRPTTAAAVGLNYDVRVHAPGTLRVDNNLAALDARADLALQGTVDDPSVVGRADVERGRIYFRGSTYVIRRGTIDFADPNRIDPFFDIEAETTLRSYRVTLKVSGTLERVHPTLTSDPPLSPLQILNLLAGADESAVANLLQAQRDQAYLAATGAATLAAGRLSEEMGLERGAQRLFGLNRFSIDPTTVNPTFAEGDVTTAARLTVGKRITPDLSVLYAQDLGGNEERLLSMELVLSDRVSLLLTRTQRPGESADYGFDVMLRHSR